MSPEQALGQTASVDKRSDVYSLGVTLYEMLTLQPIYPSANRNELLQMRAQHEPTPLRQLNKAISADLETIVHKAIAKEPVDRYDTAQEFADDLRRYLNGEAIHARRPSVATRIVKWVATKSLVGVVIRRCVYRRHRGCGDRRRGEGSGWEGDFPEQLSRWPRGDGRK